MNELLFNRFPPGQYIPGTVQASDRMGSGGTLIHARGESFRYHAFPG